MVFFKSIGNHPSQKDATETSSQTPAKSAAKNARSSRDEASFGSRLKQGFMVSLLATGAAGACPMAPATLAGLPKAQGRQLLDNCQAGAWQGPVAGTASDNVTSEVAAVASDFAWMQTRNNACAPGGVESVPLNTSVVPMTLGFSQYTQVTGGIANLNNVSTKAVEADLGTLGHYINLNVRVSTSKTTLPALVFVQGLEDSESADWNTQSTTDADGNTAMVVANINPDSTDDVARLAALGSALGLVSGSDVVGNSTESVTYQPSGDSCANATRFGALDLALLAKRYGLGAASRGNQTLTLSDASGNGGFLTSAELNNTLKVSYAGNFSVQVSLADDMAWPTLIGNSTLFLAPGSMVTNVDLSHARAGGTIIGNNHTNYITGSNFTYGDTIYTGAGTTYLTSGTQDAAVIVVPNSVIYWNDVKPGANGWMMIHDGQQGDHANDPTFTLKAGDNGRGTTASIEKNITVHLPSVPYNATNPWFPDSSPNWDEAGGDDYALPVHCSNELWDNTNTLAQATPSASPPTASQP